MPLLSTSTRTCLWFTIVLQDAPGRASGVIDYRVGRGWGAALCDLRTLCDLTDEGRIWGSGRWEESLRAQSWSRVRILPLGRHRMVPWIFPSHTSRLSSVRLCYTYSCSALTSLMLRTHLLDMKALGFLPWGTLLSTQLMTGFELVYFLRNC